MAPREKGRIFSLRGVPHSLEGARKNRGMGVRGNRLPGNRGEASGGQETLTPVACGIPGESCEDGDPCTSGDTCEDSGSAKGRQFSAKMVSCADDSCVNGSCQHIVIADYCLIEGSATRTRP